MAAKPPVQSVMDSLALALTFLFIGLTVAPPPGPPPGHPPPEGPFGVQGGSGGPPLAQPYMHGGPQGGYQGDNKLPYDFGAPSSGIGSPSGSYTLPGKLNQQQQQQLQQQQLQQQQSQPQFQYGFSADGQKPGTQNQLNKLQGSPGFYQNSFKPQDVSNSYQLPSGQAPDYQQYPAFLQQQQSQPPYSTGYPQQSPWEAYWRQSAQGQQEQQLGGFSGLPGYGYTSSSPFNGYMPQTPLGGGMGYLPSVYNHAPMMIPALHDFPPFSTGYGGVPMGVGGYGMPQVYGGQTYPQGLGFGTQGYQGFTGSPMGSPQGQVSFAQGQMPNAQGQMPNAQGAPMFNNTSSL